MGIKNKSSAYKADIDAINVQYQKALKLLHDKINLKPYDIKLIKRNEDGYSNDTFNVITKSERHLIVRVAHLDNLSRRKQELLATKLALKVNKIKILYNAANGDQIREALPVATPSLKQVKTKKFLKLLANKIKQFHSINIKNVKLEKMNYHLYDACIHNADKKYGNLFYSILNKYKNAELVFSHNDLTIWNVIYDEKHSKVSLIDFKWSGLNNRIFDIANFIRDVDLHGTELEKFFLKQYDKSISVNDVTLFVYVSSFFSYLWTYTIDPLPHIIKYRKSVWSKVNQLYNHIMKHKLVKINDYVSKLKTKGSSIKIKHTEKPLDIVYDLITKHLHVNKKSIKVLKKLTSGQTNLSFYLKLKNNREYYVRIGTIHEHIHHAIEGQIVKAYAKHISQKIIYFDADTGNCIRIWIKGTEPNKKDLQSFAFYDKLIKQLQIFHSLKVKAPNVDWSLYDAYKNKLETKYFSLFKKLSKQFDKEKHCLCHNDCSPWNVIYNHKQLSLIDIEWARVSNIYTDLANFIREANIHHTKYEAYIIKKAKLDKTKLTKMIYVLSCYAYLWTYSHPSFKILNSYQRSCKQMIVKLFKECK